jgi:hypothetical protein
MEPYNTVTGNHYIYNHAHGDPCSDALSVPLKEIHTRKPVVIGQPSEHSLF